MIKHLLCLFVVINENELALIIGSKLHPLLCDDEWVQMGRLRSDVQGNKCPHFLLEFLWSCFSWQDPPGSSRRKVAPRKNIRVFLDKLYLNLRISFCFPSLVSSFQRSDQIARHEVHVNICKAQLTKEYSHPIVF